jgi:hypothetical protein
VKRKFVSFQVVIVARSITSREEREKKKVVKLGFRVGGNLLGANQIGVA